MKDRVSGFLAVLMVTFFLPYCFTMIVSGAYREQQEKEKSGINLVDTQGNKMDLEEFLPYMIAGEIDLGCEEETLKAQAVIARTNVMHALKGKKEGKIEDLSLAYLSEADFENSFGEKKRERILAGLKKAVHATAGKALAWDGEYIEALYHKVSIGATVSSEEMYGKPIPYLVAVDSSQDVESEDYMTIKEEEKQRAIELLKTKMKGEGLAADNLLEQLSIEEKTASGFVKKVRVAKEVLSGDDFKEVFELPSTNFYLEEYNGKLRIITLGQGHCMGLSQYGANGMAKDGKKMEEILAWYYPGAKITRIGRDS